MNPVEIAVNMEKDAIDFYTEAAGKVSSPAGKKMFDMIVQDEKKHLEIVEAILKGLKIETKASNPGEETKTVFMDMKDAVMDELEATSDELEAFKVAMKMEKEGIDFYKNLLKDATDDKVKTLFEKLIDEETKHYDIFENTYTFLNDTGNWFMWDEHSIVEG